MKGRNILIFGQKKIGIISLVLYICHLIKSVLYLKVCQRRSKVCTNLCEWSRYCNWGCVSIWQLV